MIVTTGIIDIIGRNIGIIMSITGIMTDIEGLMTGNTGRIIHIVTGIGMVEADISNIFLW